MNPAVPVNDAMRIGLISDTHNHLQHVSRAAARFRAEGIQTVLHAGDITGSSVLQLLQGFDVWIAWGNMDRDAHLAVAAAVFGPGRFDNLHMLSFEGRRLALLHGDNLPQLEELIRCGDYDYVIHGHTHRVRDERIRSTRVINPGALGGVGLPPKTFAILNVATGDLQVLEV